MQKTYVIRHSADNDGRACGKIALMAFPDAIEIPYNYNEPMGFLHDINRNDNVIIMDVSLPFIEMTRLSDRCNVTWIDHHEDAHNEITPYISENTVVVYTKGVAACRLAWKHFFPRVLEPTWVFLIGCYDVYEKSNIVWWNRTVVPFEMGLRTLNDSQFLKRNFTENLVMSTVRRGRVVIDYLRIETEKLVNDAKIVLHKGLKYMVIMGLPNSLFYETERYLAEKPDILMFVNWEMSKYTWKVSIRKAFKEDINCCEIAKEWGGGGHPFAASYKTTNFLTTIGI
jgi:oligoribonuclease NrnB/cAMP/cGMP phosphodiesterase (DHH superfamily)